MKQVENFSTELNSTSWVWGGLTADIYRGRLLREHDDLDYLTLRLHELVEPLINMFTDAGWQVRRLENGDLKLEKDPVKIQLGHIELSQEVRWTHNGELGSLFFQIDWLIQQPRHFYNIVVHVVAPEFQFGLLEHPELLNPSWRPRVKDLVAKAVLRRILEAKGINVGNLHLRIRTKEDGR